MSQNGGKTDARGLQRSVARLAFSGELEEEYRAIHLGRAKNRARLWQSLEVLVAPALLLLYARNHGYAEGALPPPFLAAAVIAFTISAILLAFAIVRYDARHYLVAAAWLTPPRSAGYAVMTAYFVAHTGVGTALLTASTFGQFFFSGLLFHQALASAAITLATYLAALVMGGVPVGTVSYAITTVGVVQTMAMVVAFDTQSVARRIFLEHGQAVAAASHDALTGLRNRRDFDSRLDALWRRAALQAQYLSVLMLDVDHFKSYNDRYGHQAGDDALRRIARAIQVVARDSDVIARYGGEEFALLAQGLDEQSATALAERIRLAVEQIAIPHEASSCSRVVTVSVGVAHVIPHPSRSAAGIVQLADQNLYRAKHEGRNRCVSRGADYESLRTGRFDLPD